LEVQPASLNNKVRGYLCNLVSKNLLHPKAAESTNRSIIETSQRTCQILWCVILERLCQNSIQTNPIKFESLNNLGINQSVIIGALYRSIFQFLRINYLMKFEYYITWISATYTWNVLPKNMSNFKA